MAQYNSMKLLGNKNAQFNIEIMEWSDKMDLLAIANEKGEVMIQRLKWQKVWTLSPPEEGLQVRSIAWRSDEKIIAIAYNNGLVLLTDIENNEELHSFKLNQDIKMLCWTQNSEIEDKTILEEHTIFLANLTNLNSLSSTVKKQDYNSGKFYSKDMLNFLLIALDNGLIRIFIFGVLSCGIIDVKADINAAISDNINLVDVKLSKNFKQLFVLFEQNEQIKLVIYENSTLQKFHVPLWNIAIKYGQILNISSYIDDTIQCIVEAWERVLLEMDNKLTKYAKTQPKGSVSADFLELLMFGYPSEALDQFLTRELTEKELKKLGNSIELSYSTIQKLVVKPLHTAIINLLYHLNFVLGMNKNSFYYHELLGSISNEALINAGSFLIKSYELQQTIDISTRDYKIFFRWLYVAIIRMMDETVPDDIATVTQQEINYLAEFLNDFDKHESEAYEDNSDVKFNLERVGQYLVDKELIIPPTMECSSNWNHLMKENECLKNSALIYPHHTTMSLVQQRNLLKESIKTLFGKLEETIGSKFVIKLIKSYDITTASTRKSCATHINIYKHEEQLNLFATIISDTSLMIIECSENSRIKSIELKFEILQADSRMKWIGQLSYVDAKFYNDKIISIVLKNQLGERTTSCLWQLPLVQLDENFSEMDDKGCRIVNAYNYIDDATMKSLDGINALAIAVSGLRKVASVLSANLKIIRLYEMEVDDDEEIDISHNGSFDTNV